MVEPDVPSFDGVGDAVAWLDSHVDFESNMPRRRSLPTLDRMQALTALLGEPQDVHPVDPHHRHERQGIDLGHGDVAAHGQGPDGGHVHEPQPARRGGAPGPQR